MTSTQTADNSSAETSEITQDSYVPSPWTNAEWEVIGTLEEKLEFRPMEVKVSGGSTQMSDPMFDDFGTVKESEATRRWHLPEHLAFDADALQREEMEQQRQAVEARRREIEQARTQGYSEGRDTAISEAVAQNNARMQQIEQRLAGIFRDLDEQVKHEVVEMERQAVELALQVARKIIDQAVEINPEYIVSIIKEAITQSGSALIRKVRVSPQDMEFVEYAGLRKQLKEFDGSWDFEADETIRSGCIVETSAAEIDYQLDKAWERVREQVVKVIR